MKVRTTAMLAVAAVVAAAVAVATPATAWAAGAAGAAGAAAPPTGLTIAAVGDTMLGNTPDLPAHPGTYLALVKDALRAQITFGNLEGTLTTATHSKCGSGSPECFAFRVPPSFATYLHGAGFDVLNSANNHSHDFGSEGVRQTSAALKAHGIAQDGLPGQIAYEDEGPLEVAFLGFAPYSNVSNLLDLPAAAALIGQAGRHADLVVVYMHSGAEGANATHVTGHEELFLGEDRGNPETFAHMAVRQGADLVIASGPHVLRGMELYRHHLIAYSLGDFASYHNFSTDGVLGLSAVLQVTLGTKHGWFRSGRVVSVKLNDDGRPSHDFSHASDRLISRLSREDFGERGVRILAHGRIVKRNTP